MLALLDSNLSGRRLGLLLGRGILVLLHRPDLYERTYPMDVSGQRGKATARRSVSNSACTTRRPPTLARQFHRLP